MSCSIIRNANTNEIEKILAPNGEESKLFNSILNLSEVAGDKEKALKIWAMVYTKPFKKWFGDWENKEGSKVVDENGEPLLVYHGSSEKFDVFDVPTIANMFPSAVFFSSDISYAQYFAQAVTNDYKFLKEIYNDKLKSLTAVTDALDADKGYPWVYDAIAQLSKQSYSAKEIVDLIYKNIDNPEFFREDFERMYIQDSGDEGTADFREEPETEEEKKDYKKYQLEQEKKITDKQDEVYSLIALSDRTLDIVNALENQVNTEETRIIKKAKKYNAKQPEETLYPCFLSIKNPGYMFNMTSKNISDVREFSDNLADKDGIIGKDEKTKDVKTTSKGLEFAVFEPDQIKSVFNQGTFSTESDKIYYNLSPDTVDMETKAVNALQSDKGIQLFNALKKNKVTGDAFWNKIQNDLQIPKQQINLLKQYNTTDREELITNMLADYSYAVKINITKGVSQSTNQSLQYYYDLYLEGSISKEEYDSHKKETSTTYYSNLTVPGGTKYTENELATPAITPSIKGHAQFATDKGIGWFRSDDKAIRKELTTYTKEGDLYFMQKESEGKKEITEDFYNRILNEVKQSKTRRILELQSDLFQKGRDSELLVNTLNRDRKDNVRILQLENISYDRNLTKEEEQELKKLKEPNFNKAGNEFLQLLNKDNNWVTFFIKSIIQDSAKKGYEKVLFPTGSTAYKIESGGNTIEEFIKNKEDRIKFLSGYYIVTDSSNSIFYRTLSKKDAEYFIAENYAEKKENYKIISSAELKANKNEIEQLEREIKNAKEGASGLAAAAKFYQETVANVLRKQGYNPKQITDEYGNAWNEITITPERDLNKIYYNLAQDRTIYDGLSKESKYKYKLPKSQPIVSDAKMAMRELGVEKNDELAPHEFESLNEQFKEQDMVLLSMNQEGSNNSKVENVVSPQLDNVPNDSKIEFIINRIQELVPGVNIKFISPNEITSLVGTGVNPDRVNAFRKNNTVYLVQGRFNGEMAIEEALHPIVEAIMVKDSALAADLLSEINELFPEIQVDVIDTYTNAKGFTEADRQNEIISRGLAGLLNLRLEDNFDKKYKKTKSVIKRAIEYISKLLSDIVSKGKYYLGMKPLTYKVDQVLSMLEKGTLEYAPRIGGKIFFNLSSDQEDMYSHLFNQANDEQREVLEAIIEKNIMHDEDAHTYVDAETGESLESITSVLKGAADPRFLMRMEFGNDFDFIMNSICLGKNFDTIKSELKHMPEEVAKSFYDEFSVYTRGIRANGSIIVPQLIQADVKSKKAGKLDMLIIDPNGNLNIVDLKTTTSNYSVNSPKYDFKYVIGSQEEIDENIPMEERTTGVGSIFYGQKMSIRQQQGIQQHSYKKMIELKGFFVRGVKTLHYRTIIDNNKIVGFKFDDEVDHTASVYPEVDLIIPTEVNYKVTKLKTLEGEQAKPENREVVAQINDTVDAAVDKLKNRKKYLEGLSGNKKNVLASPEYLEALQEVINTIELTLSRGNPALAYSELVKFVNNDINDRLEKIRSGSLSASDTLTLLLESEKDFEEFEDYINTPKLRLQNKTLTRLSDEALNNIRDFKNIVQEETREYMKTFVSENTSRDLSADDIEDIIKQAEDISMQDYLFGDMATSTDTILAVIDKKYKGLLQQVYDKKDEIMRTMTRLGSELAALTPKSERNEKDMYKFMLKENKDGETTGYLVRPIGDKYWTTYDKIKEKLTDDEGEPKQYIMITNPNTADEVDIKYNQELYKAKQERNEFNKKEMMDKDGNIVDGTYHKYNTEFKEARAKHQDIEYYKDGDGNIVGYGWVRRAGISDKAYNKFLAKYFTDNITYLKPVMEKTTSGDRVFRGRVVEETSNFVKGDFVEIREIAGNGVDMRDEKYIKLMNPVTELDKARSTFYTEWIKNYEEQLDNLNPDVRKKMMNRIPIIQSHFERDVKSKGDGFMKSVLKGMRALNVFDLKAAPQTAVLDENGNVRPGIPVFYTGDTQNEWKLNNLKAKKEAFRADWKDKKITIKEYREKVKGLDTAIKIEEGKIKKSQVSNDMVLNIIEFTKMAENFKVMSEFESTVDTALRVLKKERKYTKRDAGGNLIKNAANKSIAKFAGEGSLTVSRLEKWKDMVLYRTVDPYNSKIGRLTRKLQSMMSLRSVGLNPFGQMNNYLMGRINNHIESYGGNLFAKRAYYRSVLEYQKDFIPGWFKKKANILRAKADGSSSYYEIAKPTSKYEAMASYFRMMRKLQSIDGLGTLQDRVFDLAYTMQESAEYNIQTKTGNAVIMTETLTNTKTGEVVSIYDAFDFNPNTGEIKLKDGFEFTSEQKHQITNKIYEVNKQIHGNYAYEDRMVIQQSLLGELVAQFHKWIYPMFKQKFQKGYIDENLGEIEGRYYTLWSLTKQVVMLRNAKDSWSDLSDVQKGNIYKASAEMAVMLMSYILYSILASLGEDLDDDDELVGFKEKRLLNILTAQSDRLGSEVSTGFNPKEWYRMAKNPAALFGYLGDLMEAVGATGTFITSMGDPEITRYKKGVHKGQLKLWKEWKDLLPGFYVSNRYESYETVKTFFIK